MLDTLFKKRTPVVLSQPPQAAATFDAQGIHYHAPMEVTAADWLANPFIHADTADLAARLAQIFLDGYGDRQAAEFILSWTDVYALLRHAEFSAYRNALLIPPAAEARPRLSSRGALMDADFAVFLDSWVDQYGRGVLPTPKLLGRVLRVGDAASLLPEPMHLLLNELDRYHSTPVADRTLSFKEQSFGRMRQLAISSACLVSDYVARTIVLTPERLRLAMARRGDGEAKILEVIPGFDEAPVQWLNIFDRLPLQDTYDVPDGPALVRVVLTPEVKSVLAEIKRMPGRRASGPRAEAFVRNPFGILGDEAHAVIDSAQFEDARDAAGIRFKQFTPHVARGEYGEVLRVALLIEEQGFSVAEAGELWFVGPDDLGRFTGKLGRCLDDGSQCIQWLDQELEIDGDTADHLCTLENWSREWSGPTLWTAAEVLDLSHYSDRIEEIGIEKPFLTPVIVRDDEGNGWFEENVTVGLRIEGTIGDTPTYMPLTFNEVLSLQQAIRGAELALLPSVQVPGLKVPVPLADARRAVEALARVKLELERKDFNPGRERMAPPQQKRLVIKRNLDDVDYTEARAAILQMPIDRSPVLPRSFRPNVQLKPYQLVGVAWLQNLWDMSPDKCRGTVLADDMGLGKTLQLLTFIVSCFEADSTLPPALVVAPVALLENWRNEIDRFFEPGTLPLLTLYGSALKSLRVSKNDLDPDLKAQGVTHLLTKGWRGDVRLVLTTYETMRDLEFAMASQPWSIMVCDEAQKIKTPAALVTRSAKKQKVRFRVACTGTPVENTLADLWCLFDFVQPGMLGALSHFSRTYRWTASTSMAGPATIILAG